MLFYRKISGFVKKPVLSLLFCYSLWCSSQYEGVPDQPRVVAFCGRHVRGALLLGEGEAERCGLLLLHHRPLLHHSNGGVHRPTVSVSYFGLETFLKNVI